MDYYCDVLSAVWTLILTAPIHCRASIAEQMMEFLKICSNEEINESASWWPEVEYIFSKCSVWDELLMSIQHVLHDFV